MVRSASSLKTFSRVVSGAGIQSMPFSCAMRHGRRLAGSDIRQIAAEDGGAAREPESGRPCGGNRSRASRPHPASIGWPRSAPTCRPRNRSSPRSPKSASRRRRARPLSRGCRRGRRDRAGNKPCRRGSRSLETRSLGQSDRISRSASCSASHSGRTRTASGPRTNCFWCATSACTCLALPPRSHACGAISGAALLTLQTSDCPHRL